MTSLSRRDHDGSRGVSARQPLRRDEGSGASAAGSRSPASETVQLRALPRLHGHARTRARFNRAQAARIQ